jgi:hypothetical protein
MKVKIKSIFLLLVVWGCNGRSCTTIPEEKKVDNATEQIENTDADEVRRDATSDIPELDTVKIDSLKIEK